MPGTLVHVPAGRVHGSTAPVAARCSKLTGQGASVTQMFTAINKEFPPSASNIPEVLEVLKRNGVTVAT
ncbi:hypothetical protein YTPLAS18_31590 [Nitrospira sp.]|nr:hypothetical protein YTPLAS18_31590 [Nitrospira sp.]